MQIIKNICLGYNKEFNNFKAEYSNIKSEYLIEHLQVFNYVDEDIDFKNIYVRHLEIHMSNGKIINLPEKLENLSICNSKCILDYNNLPEIKYLEIKISDVSKKEFNQLDNLPNSIETLVLPRNYNKDLSNLPNSIKNFIIKKVDNNYYDERVDNNIFPTKINSLPDCIEYLKIPNKYLKIPNKNSKTNEKISKLPMDLIKLEICSSYFLDDFSILKNYSNLKYLKIPNQIVFSQSNFVNFISCLDKLEKLILNIKLEVSDENDKLFENLSQTIKYLDLSYNKSNNIFIFDLKLDFNRLVNLKFLKISSCYSNCKIEIINLTEKIQSLILNGSEIKYFDLTNYKNLEYIDISRIKNLDNFYFETVKKQELKYLQLYFSDDIILYNQLTSLSNKLIYLEIDRQIDNISSFINFSELINLQYLSVSLNSKNKIDLSVCKNLIGINLYLHLSEPVKILFPEQLEILILSIMINYNFDTSPNKLNNLVSVESELFSDIHIPNVKVFGYSSCINCLEIEKEKNMKINDTITKNILNKIPDSIEVLGFDYNNDDEDIPLTKFPKNTKKLYMWHIASSLQNFFENREIYSTVDNEIEECRFESKEGSPVEHLKIEYFEQVLQNYHDSTEFYDPILNI